MSALGFGSFLLVLWVLLWGEASPANLISGVIVVAAILRAIPDPLSVHRPRVRPVAVVRFLARVVWDLLRANLVVTREVLSRQSSIRTGVVEVPLPGCSGALVTLVSNVLSLSPGTMPVEVSQDPPAVYLHILHLRDVEAVRADVQHLSALAVRAFGSAGAIASLPGGGRRAPAPEASS